jgi:hypothetical protein
VGVGVYVVLGRLARYCRCIHHSLLLARGRLLLLLQSLRRLDVGRGTWRTSILHHLLHWLAWLLLLP